MPRKTGGNWPAAAAAWVARRVQVRVTMKPTMRKLSGPQRSMLERLAASSELSPDGTRAAGRAASAWNRTLESLARLGLATHRSAGGGRRADITDAGRTALAKLRDGVGDADESRQS